MVPIIRLGARSYDGLPRGLAATIGALGLTNVFNPSVVCTPDALHVSVRAYGREIGVKPFHAYYLRCSVETGEPLTDPVDLAEAAAATGCPHPVADPKLFSFDGRVFATFNTGSPSATESNDVYVMQVHPELGHPQRCLYPARRRIEKNWGFADATGTLFSLYTVSPFTLLRLVDGRPGSTEPLRFARATSVAPGSSGLSHRLAIGSQPVVRGDTLTLVAHEKPGVYGYRGYVGRLVRVRDWTSATPGVSLRTGRMIHTLRASTPRLGKHNRRTLFATYFSGLTDTPSGLLASYGVNDRDYGFAFVEDGGA